MAKRGKHEPEASVLRYNREVAAVEQYWQLAGRPKPRKPPKNYKYIGELALLQFELIKLQEWVRLHGLKVVVLFEGNELKRRYAVDGDDDGLVVAQAAVPAQVRLGFTQGDDFHGVP